MYSEIIMITDPVSGFQQVAATSKSDCHLTLSHHQQFNAANQLELAQLSIVSSEYVVPGWPTRYAPWMLAAPALSMASSPAPHIASDRM